MADSNRSPTHKRQKSLSLSVNYYFALPGGHQQSQHHNQQQLGHQTPVQLHSHPVPQLLPPAPLRSSDFTHQPHHQSHLLAGHSPIHDSSYSAPTTTTTNTTAYSSYAIPPDQHVGTSADLNLVTSLPTFTTPGYPSNFLYTDTTNYLGQYPEYSSYVFPKLMVSGGGSLPNSGDFNYPGSPIKQKRLQAHTKNNLSISSHFNLFNLKEEFDPRADQLALSVPQPLSHNMGGPLHQQHPQQHELLHQQLHQHPINLLHHQLLPVQIQQRQQQHQQQHQQQDHRHLSQSAVPSYQQPTDLRIHSQQILPPQGHQLQSLAVIQLSHQPSLQPAFQSEPSGLVQQLLAKLPLVDGANINNFLLELINSFHNQISLDNFYNVLYNENAHMSQQLDSIHYPQQVVMNSVFTLESILGVFKSPQLIADHIGDINIADIKLTLVNYHELLRTFLAIKILKDVLVQVPETAVELEHTLPRLSIYKNYYIVCQKLISIYPLLLNTALEQQKIILGQLKLGKLIKLVYPELKIKRLGLRGESKYNYLGVMWNDRIVKDDILDLCNLYDLADLATYFQKKGRKISGKRKFQASRSRKRTVSGNKPLSLSSSIPKELATDELMFAPQLSFIKPFLKFPTFSDFLIVAEKLWFTNVANEKAKIIDSIVGGDVLGLIESVFVDEIQSIDTNNDNIEKQFQEDSMLLNSFIERVVTKYEDCDIPNIDLQIYLLVIVTLLPHLLLVSQRQNHLDFLLDLRQNLIFFVNGFVEQISGNFNSFPTSNGSIFCILLKKLINVNDLLITFIKLLMKDNSGTDTRSVMSADIQNYLILPLPLLLFENSQIEFNFKQDIVQNGLIFSLMGYNFTTADDELSGFTTTNSDSSPASSTVLLMKFVREEALLIEHFFKVDLTSFLSADISVGEINSWTNLLSPQENFTLRALLQLIDEKLLSEHFKSRYPILVYHNFISIILNDLLKHIYSKQQLHQIHLENSFGNWWVFNLFVEEYVRFLGEVVGLFDSI